MDYLQLFYDGQYDELVKAAFPVLQSDKDAERAFLRLFMSKNATVLLDFDETIEPLIQEANEGNPYAQYAYARWQILDRGGEYSVSISYENMKAAADQNLPDAIAGYAAALDYGDMGSADWEKADELLNQAIAMGSELGKKMKLKALCFGKHYRDAQPELATNLANQYIAQDEANGIETNGWWYYYRACSQEEKLGRLRVKDDYQLALDRGIIEAYGDLITFYGYGDRGDALKENEEYHSLLRHGIARLSSNAFVMDALREMEHYNYFKENSNQCGVMKRKLNYGILQQSHELIHAQLSNAAQLGEAVAWELLGDMYYNGDYGFEQSYKKAFTSYSNGVIHDSDSAAEKLWKMMHNHIIDRPLHYIDEIALLGARWGSKRLLAETVIIHQEGRLAEYDDEITKYYEPIFDAPEFPLDNDEDWQDVINQQLGDDETDDDDGRYDAWA